MEISKYRQMYAWLTRPGYNKGGLATPKRGLVDEPGSYSKSLSKETAAKRKKSFFDSLPDFKKRNQRKWEKANPKLNFDDLSSTTQSFIRAKGRTDLGTFTEEQKLKFRQEKLKSKLLKERSQIDNWLKNWLDNNFKNYKVRDEAKFLKDLKKDWKKTQKTEFKNNALAQSGDLPSPTPRTSSTGKGKTAKKVRNKKFFSMFNESSLSTTQAEKNRFYKRLFYAGQIDTNPELKKGINDYYKTVLADKTKIAGLSEKRIDELNRFLGKNSDVAFILGEDTRMVGPMKQKVFGSRFKDYAAYREKISKASVKYMENIKKLEEITGIPIRNEIAREQRALKKILNVKKLPPGLKYSIDHLYGISEAARNPKDKAFAKQVAENLIGGTVRQNTAAGLEGYSVRRKMLINNIKKGKNVTKSLDRLNELTTEFYPRFKNLKQPYKIVDGKLTFAKGFKGETQPERFKSYFKEIDKTKQGKQLIRKEYGGLKNLLKTKELNLAKQMKAQGFKCTVTKANGGPASCNNPRAYLDDIAKQREIARTGSGKQAINAARKLRGLKTFMTTQLGPAAIAGEIAFAVPFALADYASGESTSRIINFATFGLAGDSIRDEIVEYGGEEAGLAFDAQERGKQLEQIEEQGEMFMGPDDSMLYPDQLKGATQRFEKSIEPFVQTDSSLPPGIGERYFDSEMADQAFNKLINAEMNIMKDKEMRQKQRTAEPEEDYYGFMGARGGIANVRRPGAIPPDSGPMPQGLESLLYYVK